MMTQLLSGDQTELAAELLRRGGPGGGSVAAEPGIHHQGF